MHQGVELQDLSHQKELKGKLLSVIAQHPAGLTKNEMLIKSGISQDLIDYMLRDILEEYTIHLEVDENYQVLYVFDLKNPKDNAPKNISQFKKLWQATGRSLIFLGAIILAFSWFVMTIPIAFTILGLYLVAGFFHIFFNQGFSVGVQEYLIYWLGRADKKDKLWEEKVILSYIAENGYYFTLAELMQIMDWSYEKAEQEAVWLLVNYGGEPLVEESGVILYDFNNLKENQNRKNISNEYTIYQRNKMLERLEYRKEPIVVSQVDVFSFKSWDRRTYLTMKVYLMNYYLAAVMFLGTLLGGITIWRFNISEGNMSIAINGGRSMSSEDVMNMWLLMVIFSIGYIITFVLAGVVVWRWFAVQVPTQKAKQKAVFKSILYEYIFETLPQNTLFHKESIADKLSDYRKYLPNNDKSISTDEVIQEVLMDFKAEPIAQEDGKVAYSLASIKQELQVVKDRREKNSNE